MLGLGVIVQPVARKAPLVGDHRDTATTMTSARPRPRPRVPVSLLSMLFLQFSAAAAWLSPNAFHHER